MVSILTRVLPDEILSAAKTVWTEEEVAKKVAMQSIQILNQASRINLKFFSGKAPKCFLGGLFYLLGIELCVKATQKELADMLCTTEVSIRKSYKLWLSEFPNFFHNHIFSDT